MPVAAAPRRLSAARRNRLLARAYKLLVYLSRLHARRYRLDPYEVSQTAAVRILERAGEYDPERGTLTAWVRGQVFGATMAMCKARDRQEQVRVGLPANVADRTPDPDDQAADRDRAAARAAADTAAVAELPARVRKVVELRYGLDGGDGLSHAEIGPAVGCGRSRAQQIDAAAIKTLAGVLGPAV